MSIVTSAYVQALLASRQAVASQTHPGGVLYMVATPIGNLADISLRALYVLDQADTVACEDTRHTGQMLHLYGLHKPLLSVHEHNESQAALHVIEKLQAGERVAYVSDAGTPAISDPGSRLAAAVRAVGKRVMPIPGASSLTAALSAAGCLQEHAGFVFLGFLPPKGALRAAALKRLEMQDQTYVLLEAPHRVEALGLQLAVLGDRLVTVARELTKQFESIHTLSAAQLPAWFASHPDHARGELTLVIHAQAASNGAALINPINMPVPVIPQALLTCLLQTLPLKVAVQSAAALTGLAKNFLYDEALQIKKKGEHHEPG